MSVLYNKGLKCTLAASHAALWWVTVTMPMGQADRRTDGRTPEHCITLPLNAASIILKISPVRDDGRLFATWRLCQVQSHV